MISLKNPHSVLAALKSRPRDVQEIRLSPTRDFEGNRDSDPWSQVIALAKKNGIRVLAAAKAKAPARPYPDDGRTSVTEAIVKERMGLSVEELISEPVDPANPGLWLAFDQLQDPHNVGSIFRTAAFFGVRGVIMTFDRSAALTSTVYDVASGGLEVVPFAIVPNLQRAFEIGKDRGLWILGTSEHAQGSWSAVKKDRNWLLVFGNEEKGMRRLTGETCDVVCQIPPSGKEVTSLNVSVTAGILISKLA